MTLYFHGNKYAETFKLVETKVFFFAALTIGDHLVVFICACSSMVLFNTQQISRCRCTLFLLTPHFLFIIHVVTCVLSRDDSFID